MPQRKPPLPFGRCGWLRFAAAGLFLPSVCFAQNLPDPPEPTPVETGANPTNGKPVDCPRLDSRLYQLSLAADPASFAEVAGLHYRDGLARVVIELTEGAELPQAYGLAVELRYATLVQALVPLDALCALANESAVAFVRPVIGAQPAGPVRPPESGAN